MFQDGLKTVKIYYEFKNRNLCSTTIEFEDLNPKENTFKFTICSEYLENGKRKKIKYKEVRNDLDKIYDKLIAIDTYMVNHEVLQHDITYTVRMNDFKVSNYYDKFIEMIEVKTKVFELRRLKKDNYTKENIDEFFNKFV